RCWARAARSWEAVDGAGIVDVVIETVEAAPGGNHLELSGFLPEHLEETQGLRVIGRPAQLVRLEVAQSLRGANHNPSPPGMAPTPRLYQRGSHAPSPTGPRRQAQRQRALPHVRRCG